MNNSESWFNNGSIVHEDLKKPCHLLGYCPYDGIAEAFWARLEDSKFTCTAFGHDCPVFYISERVKEDSKGIPRKNKKLFDDVERLKLSKRKMKLYHPPDYAFTKPCYKLNFCPYGSFAQHYTSEEGKSDYRCDLYKKECPIFYFGFSASDKQLQNRLDKE